MAVRALNAFVDDKNIVGYRSFPFSNDIVKDSDRFTTYALKETCKTAIRSIDGVFEWDSNNTMFSNSKPGYICSIPYFDEVIVVPVDPFSPSETKYIIVKLCFEMDEPLIDFSYQRTNENGEIMNPNEVGCAYALFAPLKLHNI
ncbi:hypothetical protein AX774_g6350 [Zancudomyces culisetae]|uniref:Uncharacterized protein n=1 Tax=Zancudomyces culisetae TaxID=1213189 RepID=A0A1R1PGZ6_ZANCU|nr:hypothetical protein AX774_g6350 [Zancudomyces culisetae]|eukprot:OMH80218.1 hypothetical protein AX774_g6350 [Zancudomyces culisetae]